MQTKDKKEKILLAAAKVISKKGYHNTQMDDIAKEANVAKGTLYLYFESKEDLLTKFIDNIFKETFSSLNRINTIQTNSIDKIQMYVKNQLEFFFKNAQFFQIMFREIHNIDKILGAKYKQKIHTSHHKVVEVLAKIIEHGIKEKLFKPIKPELAAYILTNIISCILFQHMATKQKWNVPKQASFVVDIFLKGIQR